MNTAEILRAAAARVRRGWCQCGEGVVDPDGLCARNAVARMCDDATSDRMLHWRLSSESLDSLLRVIGSDKRTATHGVRAYADIYHWNDANGQTAENVAAGLEYAALIFEQEQQHTAATSAAESLVTCNRS